MTSLPCQYCGCCSIAVCSDGAVAPLMPLWLRPSPHVRWPLFPRHCRSNCSRFVFKNATVNLLKQAVFVTVAGCKDGVLPYWCCGCVAFAVCRNAAVAFLMLRLLWPSLSIGTAVASPMLRLSCEQNTAVFPASTAAAGVVALLLLPCQCCGCCDPCCGQDDAVALPRLRLLFEHFY